MDETLSDIARLRREADRCRQLAAEETDTERREHYETLGHALDQLADLLRAAVTKVMNLPAPPDHGLDVVHNMTSLPREEQNGE